jgi:hypothetical protein
MRIIAPHRELLRIELESLDTCICSLLRVGGDRFDLQQ